jgi:hypothetical protein
MNALNKVLVVLAVLLAIPVCVALLVAPVQILGAAGGGLEAVISWLEAVPSLLRVVLGILCALAWLVICVLFLVLELRRPPARTVRLEKVGGGEVEVSLRTVGEHIAYGVDQLPGVLRVRPSVSARRGGVVIELEVDTAGDMDVPVRAAQVVEAVRSVVEERVGVRLARPPKVRLRAAPISAVPRREVEGPFEGEGDQAEVDEEAWES